MSSSYSLNKPSSINEEGYSLWKEKMKFFIEGTNCGIQNVLKESPFIPIHNVDGFIIEKPEKDTTKANKQNVQHGLKAKNIISTNLGIDEFL